MGKKALTVLALIAVCAGLVYGRSAHSGGTGHEGTDHLNRQVLAFAKDLHRLTRNFATSVEPKFRGSVEAALKKAFDEADRAAKRYGIVNPL